MEQSGVTILLFKPDIGRKIITQFTQGCRQFCYLSGPGIS